ncbi:DUF3854 domain-containing protein [Coleofasciculus sp. FACHB-129]|uniref:DUF3854 domain-containing protein n=1 Tax=Cyanophyceae TaxID=3028117 RepID=UPI001689FD91|nr:DUF3854 domain-containing protein [Coleofasciculus sp. FACHB-129]MBD1895544.1 DUF3854 domain-containing protein [Coleofasciculus sp. FACHB-129]
MVAPTSGNKSFSSVESFPAHQEEWVNGSRISSEIACLNLKSLDDPTQIAQLLSWKAYGGTAGWYVQGIDPITGADRNFGQFKPNEPIQFPDSDKPQKYFSFPKGAVSEAIFLRISLSAWQLVACRYGVPMPHQIEINDSGEALGFWAWILEHPEIPITITEGVKKAACLLSGGYVGIALTGVWNGQQKKRILIPTLQPFVTSGRPVDLAFDADIVVKTEVQSALKFLGHLLNIAKAIVRIVTWDLQLGKGCDDFIVAHGQEKWDEVVNNATPYSEWLKKLEQQFHGYRSLDNQRQRTGKIPPADMVAHEIAQEYREQLAFNDEIGYWMRYEADHPGMWSIETNEYMESIVAKILDSKGIRGYGAYSYVTNVVKSLRVLLIKRKWVEPSPKQLLPFRNGVLEISTCKLLPHSPGYHFTWQLPRDHDPNGTNWSRIEAFLDHLSNGNTAIKETLLCFCNAVLKGRKDLHKFLHLIGLGGTGKGTFGRLLTDLIGSDNIYSTTLEDWCGNRFEAANAYKKRLVVFWDEDKQTGKLGKFLSLTGDDWIRAEEKGKKGFQYQYDGLTLVLSNLPIFTGDAASRIARRVITVPCNNPVSTRSRRDLNAEFTGELDAFTNHVLSLSDAHVTKVLMGLVDIPECTLEFWENRARVDSIAAWVNDWVIYDVLAVTPVGNDKEEGFNGTPRTLYGSYCLHCKQSGTSPKANKNFSPDLLELCRSVLGWEVSRKVTKIGKFIQGLRLRTDWDTEIPTHDFLLMQRVTEENSGGRSEDDGLNNGLGDGSQVMDTKASSLSDESSLIYKGDSISEEAVTIQSNYEQWETSQVTPKFNLLLNKGSEESLALDTVSVTGEETREGQLANLESAASDTTSDAAEETPALQLANLLLQCQAWAEIENAISLYEAYKNEAWKLLDPQQQQRIKTLKVRSLLRVGSRVCIDPSSWSPLSPYIGKLGTVRKVTDLGYYEVQPDGENKRINYAVEDLKPVETQLGFGKR